MERRAIEDRLDQLYRARLDNDPEGCLANFSELGTFSIAAFADDGEAQITSTGTSELANRMEELVDTWRWVDRVVLRSLIDGNEATVRYRLVAQHRPTARTIVTEIMDYLKFDDRTKVVEFVEYLDTAMLQRVDVARE